MNNGLIRLAAAFVLGIALPWITGCGAEPQGAKESNAESGTSSIEKEANRYFDAHKYAQAAKSYRKAAEQGSPDAQLQLGLIYLHGLGEIDKNDIEAVKWFRKAAEQGAANGQYEMCVMYHDGTGIEQDYGKAVEWCIKAANQGNSYAQSMLGIFYEQGLDVEKDYSAAIKWYRMAAEQNDAGAQSLLGTMYRDGKGVPQDHSKAAKWYKKAADQGTPFGQFELGSMLLQGDGVPQNTSEAVVYFRKGAELGQSACQSLLGAMYEKGIGGLSQDYRAAEKWYRKAAAQGNQVAKDNLHRMAEERKRSENALGVVDVKLGMTATQMEHRLGEFKLLESDKALSKSLTGGFANLTPEDVDKTYIAVTTDAQGLLNRPSINPKTGKLQMEQPKFEKDGFKFWELEFTRKELGPKLFSMEVSREFDTRPNWDLVQNKLVEKYGAPGHTNVHPSCFLCDVKKQLLWGECKPDPKYFAVSQCKGAALLVNFEEGSKDFAGTYSAIVRMKFLDGNLKQENEVAIQKARRAKETKTASQLENMRF